MATFTTGPAIVTFNGVKLGAFVTYSVVDEPWSDVDDGRTRPALGDPISSCPHKPGTDEWKQWQHDYLAINPSTSTSAPDDFDRDVEDRELGRMLASSRLPVERVAYLNQMMREARDAIDTCGPDRKPFAPHGIFFEWTIDTSAAISALQALSASFTSFTNVLRTSYPFDPWLWSPDPVYGPPRPTRATRRTSTAHNHGAKRKRPPAPSARACHHGNPSNHCRDCSMGRR